MELKAFTIHIDSDLNDLLKRNAKDNLRTKKAQAEKIITDYLMDYYKSQKTA